MNRPRRSFCAAGPAWLAAAMALILAACAAPVASLTITPPTLPPMFALNRMLLLERIAPLEPQAREALALLQDGSQRDDGARLGAAARLSALAYQAVCFSDLVAQAARWATELGAGGPARPHSGSIVGLLFDDVSAAQAALDWLRPKFLGEMTLAYTLGKPEDY